MFILPPPPRHVMAAAAAGYGNNLGPGGIPPLIETNNTISNPTGPEWQFMVGEGIYTLKEDLHLATPPPHPSDAPIINPNPLDTTPLPPTAGTRISLLNLDARSDYPSYRSGTSASTITYPGGPPSSIQEHPAEGRYSAEAGKASEDGSRTSNSTAHDGSFSLAATPAFGEGNNLLAAAPVKDASKRRKPKNSMTKSNSSFISRVILHENLSRRLAERPSNGLFAFANINRAFHFLDLSSPNKQDFLTKILFTKAHCLCHDVNLVTRSANHIDVVMGFSTGELIWWEPISQKYVRLNKNGAINGTPVHSIRWIPGSENLFLAAHKDGQLIVYHKEKEDAPFVAEPGVGQSTSGSGPGDKQGFRSAIKVLKSVHSKNQKFNPVSAWKLSNQRINAVAFSPDRRHLAAVSDGGSLRIIDYLNEKLLVIMHSYYDALTCVCWSPDGRYFLAGGQDDLISIWSLADMKIVARFRGHTSWVSAVAFDPWRCEDRTYRFGSVGEDCKLCLWDFNVAMLPRQKPNPRNRGSVSGPLQHVDTNNSLRSGSNAGPEETETVGLSRPVEPNANVPMLPPVLRKVIHEEPACWLDFTEDAIMTSSLAGHIRTWSRPRETGIGGASNAHGA